MNICRLVLAALALAASASAQHDLGSRLRPITTPLRRAGVFHVATGTWTRNASLANLVGPDTIYNNTCSPAYFASQVQGEKWQHRSRVPTSSANGAPTTPSVFYGSSSGRNDEAPGCKTSYMINGFEFVYCTSSPGPVDYVHEFANSYAECANADMVPDYSFTITGLPGSCPMPCFGSCWIVDVDLSGTTPAFVLSADGDGTYVGPSTAEQFGWSFGPTSPVLASHFTGPVIAGNTTWTGGQVTGQQVPCTGTDGTIWDSPVNLAEFGTGMASNNFFRKTGTTTASSGPGCYTFGGNPHADFYLKLFSNPQCVGPPSSMQRFCFPGQGFVIPCPCNNPPAGGAWGCNNFGAGPGASCMLEGTGVPSIANDTAVLHSTGENNTSATVFLQSPSSSSTGHVFGAGVRCITGTLRRLYTGNASGGAISRPGSGDPDIHTRSAAVGDPLAPGVTRYYMTYYRDPLAAGPCSNSASTFNSSQGGKIVWQP